MDWILTRERFDAILFDLDGVLTDTAGIHAACWKRMFDAFLETRAEAGNDAFRPFDIETDYPPYVATGGKANPRRSDLADGASGASPSAGG
jgi:beta-phosphoglucomutase-like phosphatase (HAD superfamily)